RVNPESLDESAAFLNTLRKGSIKHYGLLTVLTFQSDYNFTVSSTLEIIAYFHGRHRHRDYIDRVVSFREFCKAMPSNTINIDNRDHTVLLCQYSDFTGGAENYIGNSIYTYGGFSNSSKVLTLSEYKDSLAAKFLKAITEFRDSREDTAWLLYNVHNEGPNNSCPEPPFTVLKHLREAMKGVENATYH
ncbi:hypothetical protein MRX96_049798, partial [Rhipicephalus microplus]